MYRRLFKFLRPHRGLMFATILSRVIAAAFDAFSLLLLIPFLRLLKGYDVAPGAGAAAAGSAAQGAPAPAQGAGIDGALGISDVSGGEWLQGVLGAIEDVLAPLPHEQRLMVVILFILATVIVKNVFVWWGGVAGARLQEVVSRDMRDQVYAHVIRLPMTYHLRTKLGQILSRILADTRESKAVITQLVTQALQNIATIGAKLWLLFGLSVVLSFYALVIAPLVIVAIQPLLRRLRRGFSRSHSELGEMNSLAQEVLSGARLVKASGAEDFEERRFSDASQGYARGLIKVNKYAFMTQPTTEIIGTAVAVGLLWLGANEVMDGTMSSETLIVFLVTTLGMLQPLKQLSQLPAVAQGSFAAAERLFDVLDRPTEIAVDRGSREITEVEKEIRFTDVHFEYDVPEEDERAGLQRRTAALSGISFVARRGEIVALVGPSGAGKSTLVDLIPRFYEPTAGAITIDGVNLRDIRLPALRRLTGIVSQETVLFNDTVRNNIAYGAAEKFSDAQVERAARLANAHEFIMQLPDGYSTSLGERGSVLSGGQRQRLSIARALLADPRILIFDEATSALDTESERLVQEAIDRLLEGRTVFVIAHRLSTVIHADQILVLDGGRIVERGTHTQLLAQNGLYARLHAMQFNDNPAPVGDPV